MSGGRDRNHPESVMEKSMVGVEEAQPEPRGAKQIHLLQIWASPRAFLPGALAHLREFTRQENELPRELVAVGKGLAETREAHKQGSAPHSTVNEKFVVGELVQRKRM